MAKKDAETEDAGDEKEKDAPEGEEGAEGAEGTEGEGGGKKLTKKKLIIIGAIAAVVLIGGGVGAFFAFSGGHGEGAESAEGGEKKPGNTTYFDLPEILVNLNTGGRQTSFLKMSIAFEMSSEEDVKVVQANLPRILDSFNTYLRELRAADLYGSASMYRLREELLVRVNKQVAPAKVQDILFKQILVQ